MLPNEAVQPAIHLAIELSSSAWLVAVQPPAAEKVSVHRMNVRVYGFETRLCAYAAMSLWPSCSARAWAGVR